MNVMIIGAAGMIGRKLAERIAADGTVGGRTVDAMHLVDVIEPSVPAGKINSIATEALDLSLAGSASRLVERRPDLIFHFAAIRRQNINHHVMGCTVLHVEQVVGKLIILHLGLMDFLTHVLGMVHCFAMIAGRFGMVHFHVLIVGHSC